MIFGRVLLNLGCVEAAAIVATDYLQTALSVLKRNVDLGCASMQKSIRDRFSRNVEQFFRDNGPDGTGESKLLHTEDDLT